MAAPRLALAPLWALLLLLAAAHALPEGRILGGEDATATEYPWTASLRHNKAHTCMAAIISSTHLLTAAHCVSELGTTPVAASSLGVRVGSINQYAGGQIVNVKSVLIHPSYGNFLHDLAIVTLSEPLVYTERIAAATLPTKVEEGGEEEVSAELPHNTPVYVAGWGAVSDGSAPYKLQKANYNTVSAPFCELAAGYGYASTLCLSSAEREGICSGDAGAAVIDDDKVLQGLTSFHFADCGSSYPDVASRIYYYLDWIEANTQEAT
ncbi:trypsin alpha [Drosophila subobscura]|uniref:trypsin alpha n=1 Tax=Drosophila subobscura TaxID=7241 RepID=UPI00155AA4AF|nr:trypsin alpha [Drosophila subobscura]